MSSVLGSGILILPGLAAQKAGPASLIAWVGLSLVSYPLAYTFASLSSRRPESGGVYSFAREAFGQSAATSVGWLFLLWYAAGAQAVTVVAAVRPKLFIVIVVTTALPATTVPLFCEDVSMKSPVTETL